MLLPSFSFQSFSLRHGLKNNIISSFRCTGIYPFNPSIILKKLPKDSEQKANDDEVGMSLESGADTVQPNPLKVAEFSPEELERIEKRFENGYDIFTDEKYMAWLRQYHPDPFHKIYATTHSTPHSMTHSTSRHSMSMTISQTVMEIFHRRNLNALKNGLRMDTTSSPTRNMCLAARVSSQFCTISCKRVCFS